MLHLPDLAEAAFPDHVQVFISLFVQKQLLGTLMVLFLPLSSSCLLHTPTTALILGDRLVLWQGFHFLGGNPDCEGIGVVLILVLMAIDRVPADGTGKILGLHETLLEM